MMDTQTQAHLHLADERGCSQTAFGRSYHTFNVGAYRSEGREPFGALHRLNDDTLRAGAALSGRVFEATDVLLLPVVGGLEYQTGAAANFLEPGQAGTLSLPAGATYRVSNPYDAHEIQFLQIWLTGNAPAAAPAVRVVDFDLTQKIRCCPCCPIR